MGALSIWHVLIVLGIGVVLLGGGGLSALMADLGGGLGAFRRAVQDEPPGEMVQDAGARALDQELFE